MAISHIPASIGHNFTPEYQLSAVPFFIDADEGTSIGVNAQGKVVDSGGTDIKEVKLPKISQWLHFKNASGSPVTVYFSRKEAVTGSSKKGIIIEDGEITRPLRIRCSSLYFIDGVGSNFHIIAGLTAIPGKEFENVVESFLGDDIT